jgi:hypothetical protein
MVLAAVATASGQQQQLPPPFPRANATLLLENDRIRAWDIVWPKGQPTAMHRHIYDQVGTYYMPGGRRITQPDGDVRTNFTEVGSLSTTKRGTTHIEEGTTDPPLRAVFIELKQNGPSGVPPAASRGASRLPGEGTKQLLNDERVSVWDLTWGSGPGSLRYAAVQEAIVVWLGDGVVRATSGSASTTITVRPGAWRHLARGADEILEMVEGSPRTMIFEIK